MRDIGCIITAAMTSSVPGLQGDRGVCRRGRFTRWCAVLTLATVAMAGCSDDDSSANACADFDCSGHGQCAVATSGPVCICDGGYHAVDTTCEATVPGAECDGVPCSDHGQCIVVSADTPYPYCLCEIGYTNLGDTSCVAGALTLSCGAGTHQDGYECVPDPPGTSGDCPWVDCGPGGSCHLVAELPQCTCGTGYTPLDATHCVSESKACTAQGGEVPVTNAAGFSRAAVLAARSDSFAVVWQDNRPGTAPYDIWFQQVSGAGALVGDNTNLTDDATVQGPPAIAAMDAGYLVAWTEDSQVYAVQVAADGTNPGAVKLVSDAEAVARYPQIAVHDTGAGMVWTDTRGGSSDIVFASLDASGTKVGDDVVVAQKTTELGPLVDPSIVWTGTEFGVAWAATDIAEIYFARLDKAGSVMGDVVRVTKAAGGSSTPTLAWTGQHFVIVWQDQRELDSALYSAHVDGSGKKLGADVRVTPEGTSASASRLIWTGSRLVLAYLSTDVSSFAKRVVMTPLTSTGLPLGIQTTLSQTAHAADPRIALAWDGNTVGVAWVDDRDMNNWEVYFQRASCN